MNVQRFSKGDFVELKAKSHETGIIVDIRQNNVIKSRHADHINDSYSYVYYVLTEGSCRVEGPYFPDELSRLS